MNAVQKQTVVYEMTSLLVIIQPEIISVYVKVDMMSELILTKMEKNFINVKVVI